MHIVIMGCGRVGSLLAHRLAQRNHSVAVVDQVEESFRRLPPEFAGQRVVGVGFDRDVMIEAGVERASAFAAVSSGDNSNIISARVARETFGVENVVARIYDPGRADLYQRLGIPTVGTVRWTTDQMLRRLLPAGADAEWRDATGHVVLAEVHTHPGWVGHRIAELEAAVDSRIACVTRLSIAFVPNATHVLQDGDLVHVAVDSGRLHRVEEILGEAPGTPGRHG